MACSTEVSASSTLAAVGAAALGDVVLAAAAAAEGLAGRADQVAGLEAAVAGALRW